MANTGLLFFLGAVSALAQTPDGAEQSRALAAIRDYALHYTTRLPDYMCTQVMHRTYFPIARVRGRPRLDSFEEQITFVDHKGSYTVTRINGKAVANGGRDQLGGIFSSGEFGTLLARTFDPTAGREFRWERETAQNGRRMYVYAFRVPQARGYGLVEFGHTLLVPYKGLLYADPQTGAILRVEMQCENPQDSEYKELELNLDYKPALVAGQEFTLPFHYRLHTRRAVLAVGTGKPLVTGSGAAVLSETINEADFKAYRRFAADSSVTFGGEAAPK
jgi:hypothetical protein